MVGVPTRFHRNTMVNQDAGSDHKTDATANAKKEGGSGDVVSDIKTFQEVQTSKLITHILKKFEKKINRKELKEICGQIDERFRSGKAKVLHQPKLNPNVRKSVADDYNSACANTPTIRLTTTPTLKRRARLNSRRVGAQDGSSDQPTTRQSFKISSSDHQPTTKHSFKISSSSDLLPTTKQSFKISSTDQPSPKHSFRVSSVSSSDPQLSSKHSFKISNSHRHGADDMTGSIGSSIHKVKSTKIRKTLSESNATYREAANNSKDAEVCKENFVRNRIFQWNKLQEKSYCRLCGKEKESRYCESLFSEKAKENDLLTKVVRTCGVDVKENDPLPKVICRICEKFVTKMSDFRKMCQRTQLKFSFKRSVMNAPRLALPAPPVQKDLPKEPKKSVDCKEMNIKNKRTKQRILIASQIPNEININLISMVTVDPTNDEPESTEKIEEEPESVYSVYHDSYISQPITTEEKEKLAAAVSTDQPSEIASIIVNECPSIAHSIKKRILNSMNNSCTAFGQVNDSVLHHQFRNDSNAFNAEKVYTEIRSIIPFFIDILNSVAGKEIDLDRTGTDLRIKYALVYAILMEVRWHDLSLISRLIANLIKSSNEMQLQYMVQDREPYIPPPKRELVRPLIGGHFKDVKYGQGVRGISNNYVLNTLKGELIQDNQRDDYHLFSSNRYENRVSFLRISRCNPKADIRLLPTTEFLHSETSEDFEASATEMATQIFPQIFSTNNVMKTIIKEHVPHQFVNDVATYTNIGSMEVARFVSTCSLNVVEDQRISPPFNQHTLVPRTSPISVETEVEKAQGQHKLKHVEILIPIVSNECETTEKQSTTSEIKENGESLSSLPERKEIVEAELKDNEESALGTSDAIKYREDILIKPKPNHIDVKLPILPKVEKDKVNEKKLEPLETTYLSESSQTKDNANNTASILPENKTPIEKEVEPTEAISEELFTLPELEMTVNTVCIPVETEQTALRDSIELELNETVECDLITSNSNNVIRDMPPITNAMIMTEYASVVLEPIEDDPIQLETEEAMEDDSIDSETEEMKENLSTLLESKEIVKPCIAPSQAERKVEETLIHAEQPLILKKDGKNTTEIPMLLEPVQIKKSSTFPQKLEQNTEHFSLPPKPIRTSEKLSSTEISRDEYTKEDCASNLSDQTPLSKSDSEMEPLQESSWSSLEAITEFTQSPLLEHSCDIISNGSTTSTAKVKPSAKVKYSSGDKRAFSFSMTVDSEVCGTYSKTYKLKNCVQEEHMGSQDRENEPCTIVKSNKTNHGTTSGDVKIVYVNTEVMITTLEDDGRGGKEWIVNRKKTSNSKNYDGSGYRGRRAYNPKMYDASEYLGNKSYYESPNRYEPLYLEEPERETRDGDSNSKKIVKKKPLRIETKQKSRSKKKRSKDKKRFVYIIGDGMLRTLRGIDLKRKLNTIDSIFVRCFPGATTNEMVSYSRTTMEKNPSCVILHCGTNDLSNGTTANEIAINIVELASILKNQCRDIMISGIIPRHDRWDVKRQMVNMEVRNKCSILDIAYRDHQNIDKEKDLNKGGVNLNKRGSSVLFQNYVDTLQSFKWSSDRE